MIVLAFLKPLVMDQPSQLPTILVIEDEELLQEMCTEAFTKSGFTVIQARNGLEGVEKFRDNPAIKACIVDIMLPKLSGYEVIREIRTLSLDRQVPIIVFSALDATEAERDSQDAGATIYISKGDVSLKDLVEKVKSYTDF
jgi:two-component system OmpR family response regulator